jgi:protein SCO1/2
MIAATLAMLLLATAPAPGGGGGASIDVPPALREVRVDEQPGARLPLDVRLRNEEGQVVTLGRFFTSDEPVVIVLAYYECPMLCGLVLNGLAATVGKQSWRLGEDFRAVTVSIDPRESSADARAKKDEILGQLPRRPPPGAWSFLVADRDDVRRLANALGYGYRYDEQTGQYAHPAVIMVATPNGQVSSYLYGFDPAPDELAAALETAAAGGTRRSLEQVLMQCFQYTPALRRHAGAIATFLKVGGAVILLGLVAVVFFSWRRRGSGAAP